MASISRRSSAIRTPAPARASATNSVRDDVGKVILLQLGLNECDSVTRRAANCNPQTRELAERLSLSPRADRPRALPRLIITPHDPWLRRAVYSRQSAT